MKTRFSDSLGSGQKRKMRRRRRRRKRRRGRGTTHESADLPFSRVFVCTCIVDTRSPADTNSILLLYI